MPSISVTITVIIILVVVEMVSIPISPISTESGTIVVAIVVAIVLRVRWPLVVVSIAIIVLIELLPERRTTAAPIIMYPCVWLLLLLTILIVLEGIEARIVSTNVTVEFRLFRFAPVHVLIVVTLILPLSLFQLLALIFLNLELKGYRRLVYF